MSAVTQQQVEAHAPYLGFIGFGVVFIGIFAAAALFEFLRERKQRR